MMNIGFISCNRLIYKYEDLFLTLRSQWLRRIEEIILTLSGVKINIDRYYAIRHRILVEKNHPPHYTTPSGSYVWVAIAFLPISEP